MLQLTGRANYREYGERLCVDLEGDPSLAAEPLLSLKIACEYWKSKKLNKHCDADNISKITYLVNGGYNGFDDCKKYLKRAMRALRTRMGLMLGTAQGDIHAIVRRGSVGDLVVTLQEKLRAAGLEVAIDGDFGPATEMAVTVFQRDNGLTIDGIVGKATWKALG